MITLFCHKIEWFFYLEVYKDSLISNTTIPEIQAYISVPNLVTHHLNHYEGIILCFTEKKNLTTIG